jgi:hypothetical protein
MLASPVGSHPTPGAFATAVMMARLPGVAERRRRSPPQRRSSPRAPSRPRARQDGAAPPDSGDRDTVHDRRRSGPHLAHQSRSTIVMPNGRHHRCRFRSSPIDQLTWRRPRR